MSKYIAPLKKLRVEYKEQYAPETAFGDAVLEDIQNQINVLEEAMGGKDECSECDGWGTADCECCGQDVDCTECGGIGLVDKF